jgi:DNA-binding GntR family transcriptional regulator
MADKRSAPVSTSGNGTVVNGERARGLFKNKAYAEIKRLILVGDLPPGAFLAERQLAGRLGMSTTPVRSALERLQSEGFLSIAPQQGAVVRDISVSETAELYEIRAALETFVVRGLAARLTSDQVRLVDANLEAQRANLGSGDVERSVALDEEFHGLFYEFQGNREILKVNGQLRDRTHRLIRRVFTINPSRIAESYAEHKAIADAVANGDAALAVRRVEEHLELGRSALLSPRRL